MRALGAEAVGRLRRRPGRALLAALGVLAASAMLGAAVTVAVALAGGFDRAARRADLPDVIARFEPLPRAEVDARVRALPNLVARAYRSEALDVPLAARGHASGAGAVQVVEPGRRGYAVVSGRDVHGATPTVVVERGLARAWGLRVGDRLEVGDLGPLRVAGEAVAPDNVAYPLAATARVYVTRALVAARYGSGALGDVNEALLWTASPSQDDVLLAQARATSYGVEGLRFITRPGVRVLVDQAAGIVIALLVAVSLVALAVAGVMLAASARSEIQRALPAIGVRRALGASRARVTALHAVEAALLAGPAALAGVAAGAGLAAAPSARLLEALNQLGPGVALLGPLALAWLGIVALVTLSAAGPAWTAGGAPPVALLRGAELAGPPRRAGGGLAALGVRLATARRARAAATIAVLAVSAGFVALMLALGSLLDRLEHDPGSVGKRYQLAVHGDPRLAREIAALPGVAAAAPRLVIQGADSFALGEPVKLIAYPGDHTRFEAPPLAAGRRVRGAGEAEVGQGLASALGLELGGRLAVQLPDGGERRWRVVGIVRGLDNDGRVAFARPDGLSPDLGSRTVAVRLAAGASEARVRREIAALTGGDGGVSRVGGATASSAPFLGTVATLVRTIAAVDLLVCLFALAQALALTARERRPTIAVLRALGAGRGSVAVVFAGAAAALVVPAALAGLLLERLVLGPAVGRLAAGYVGLPLAASGGQAALVAGGLATLAALAAAWTAARIEREPVIAGLREE